MDNHTLTVKQRYNISILRAFKHFKSRDSSELYVRSDRIARQLKRQLRLDQREDFEYNIQRSLTKMTEMGILVRSSTDEYAVRQYLFNRPVAKKRRRLQKSPSETVRRRKLNNTTSGRVVNDDIPSSSTTLSGEAAPGTSAAMSLTVCKDVGVVADTATIEEAPGTSAAAAEKSSTTIDSSTQTNMSDKSELSDTDSTLDVESLMF